MNSIFFRNFLTTTLLVLSCFLLIGIAFFVIGENYLVDDTTQRLDASANEVVRSASAISRDGDLSGWDLRMTLSSVANSSNNHIFICDADGKIVSCSDKLLHCRQHEGKEVPASILKAVGSTRYVSELTDLGGIYMTQRFVVARPISLGGVIAGYVFVSSEDVSALGAWRAFAGVIITVSFAVMLAAILLSLVLSKRLAQPLDQLAIASRKVAHGDFTARVEKKGKCGGEIGTLVDSFNSMTEELQKSDQNRRELIANISHELRTPMTTIAGFADGILDGTIPKEQEERYLQKIADETHRLSRLVRNMLDMSQAESKATDKSRRTKFDLSELTLKTLLSFESRASEKDLDVDPQLPEDPIMVFADADSITQVIYNLTDNAIKFAEKGSTISIRVYKKNGKAFVAVKNRGETIPPDDLPYIFDRFHKSDRSRSMDKDGVGLGLYLVKTILNSHDEDIAVSSRDGITVFAFTLPLA